MIERRIIKVFFLNKINEEGNQLERRGYAALQCYEKSHQ